MQRSRDPVEQAHGTGALHHCVSASTLRLISYMTRATRDRLLSAVPAVGTESLLW